MFSATLKASAQSGSAASSALAGSATPGGSAAASANADGYRILGEAQPKEAGQKYAYTREMPDGSDGVYWYVAGAAVINETPANTYAGGRLDANENPELSIVWDLAGKDTLVLQLRRDNPESKTGVDVLADLGSRHPFTCTGNINYYGPSGNMALNALKNDQFLCIPGPRSVPPFPNGVTYRFFYDTPYCNYYIWTMKYHTVSGAVYQEQWLSSLNSLTYGNFALYTQVPVTYHSVNPALIDPFTGAPYPTGPVFLPHNPPTGPSNLSGQAVAVS